MRLSRIPLQDSLKRQYKRHGRLSLLVLARFPKKTSGGTESDNWAIKGTAYRNHDHRATITTAFEHHAVLHACEAIERLGYPVAYIWPDRKGTVAPDVLALHITDETKPVSVMYANNEIGSIQPIKELCAIAHAHGALFHTDAVQAVGHVEIDVQELDVDMLSASAHKFNVQLDESLAKGTIRISLGKSNTPGDVNAIVSALYTILKP